MNSNFWRNTLGAQPSPLKTKEVVTHLGAQLRAYAAAPDASGRDAAVMAAQQLLAQYESSKAHATVQHPEHIGARLELAKLDSLARKLAAAPGFSAADAQAFFELVLPPLADRLGLVSMLSTETGLAKDPRSTAQQTLAQATQQAAALVQEPKGSCRVYAAR